jgi:hypothetical protein
MLPRAIENPALALIGSRHMLHGCVICGHSSMVVLLPESVLRCVVLWRAKRRSQTRKGGALGREASVAGRVGPEIGERNGAIILTRRI